MEMQELEKILEKLKKVDIQRWKCVYEPSFLSNFLFVETDGLRFSITTSGSIRRIEGDTLKYTLFIENVEDEMTNIGGLLEYTFDKKNKPQRKILEKFYEQTLASFKECKQKMIKEKLNNFLLE